MLTRSLRSSLILITMVLAFLAGSLGVAQAQTAQGLAALPPALRAAVQSGNSNAITQAINTLSGGNSTTAATLAAQTIAVAEQLLSTNPTAALAVASAAVQVIQPSPVQQGAPPQTETVLATAARIFVNPAVTRALPEQAAALATATVQAAITNGSPTIIGTVSDSAVKVAEQILPVNPSAAVNLASLTVNSVRNLPVQQGAPVQTLDVVVTAARIMIQPIVQQLPLEQRSTLASNIVAVASGSVVQQQSGGPAVLAATNNYLSTATSTQQPATQQTQSPLTPAERFNDTRPPAEENLARRGSAT